MHEYGLAEDIRCLVQTYLSSRLAALPTNVYNPTLMVNGESQEDWGFEQPDMNDLAMLDLIDGRPEDKLAALVSKTTSLLRHVSDDWLFST